MHRAQVNLIPVPVLAVTLLGDMLPLQGTPHERTGAVPPVLRGDLACTADLAADGDDTLDGQGSSGRSAALRAPQETVQDKRALGLPALGAVRENKRKRKLLHV
jgi:hypothetical protein